MNEANFYRKNVVTGATANPYVTDPSTPWDVAFAQTADALLTDSVELIRHHIGAHQAAVAVVVDQDWRYVRKFFSLSEKYAAWADYNTPAVGFGMHAWLLSVNQTIRLTHDELLAHPQWKGFGIEAGKHPPMRGWLAGPILDATGKNWGLLQVSDRYESDFTADDEAQFTRFARLLSRSLEAAWTVRNLRATASAG